MWLLFYNLFIIYIYIIFVIWPQAKISGGKQTHPWSMCLVYEFMMYLVSQNCTVSVIDLINECVYGDGLKEIPL